MKEPVINPNGRSISTPSTSTLKDLVFNPETGDFEQVERGSTNEGDTVTKMTEDGFATDEEKSSKETLKDSNLYDFVYDPELGKFIKVPRKEIEDNETIIEIPPSICL